VTAVDPMVVRGIPLVRLSGQVTERSGAELAAAVMEAIHYYTAEMPEQFAHPLSDSAPQTGR